MSITEGFFTNGVTEILKNLVSAIAQEISLAWGVKDDLKKLHKTLQMILAVIADAERRQVTDLAVRLWLIWLKDVAYEADDVMDEFSYETMRRCQRGNRLKHKLHDFVSSSNNPLVFAFKMAKQIKDINRRLDEITKQMYTFQLQAAPVYTSMVHGESSAQWSRQTASSINESDIIGREDDKKRIVDLLTKVIPSSSSSTSSDNNPEKVSVVSIVGFGGLGKTSLAQLAYKDELVQKQFELTMWVHVSEYFDVEKLLTKIMESLTRKKFDTLSNYDVLVSTVEEQLNGKRYLLVLDDLWNENADQWERLCGPLLVGAQGSKILITTRKTQVADVVKGSIPPYKLEQLQQDECWSIIKKRAFSPDGAAKTPNMINIGKEIAKRSSGLPLAAKFLGSLMHSRNKESDWLSIRETGIWNTQEGQSEIRPILKLSYDNLSPQLKQCFSYCTIFPKGCEIERDTLVHLWMAEGFLGPSSNIQNERSIEDIGEEYFDSLVWSSFLDALVKKNEFGDIIACKMHDLVHDLGQQFFGEHECAAVKVSELEKTESDLRRVQLTADAVLSESSSEAWSRLKKLRTIIIPEPNSNSKDCTFSSNKKLRVLHFGRMADSCPDSAMRVAYKLRHLRYFYLSNRNLNGMTHDDHSISKSYNLQTLVLRECTNVQNLLENMGSLKNLRSLDISFSDIRELPDSVTSLCNLRKLNLCSCSSLTTFPNSVTGLKYLIFLKMSHTPIEELPGFIINLHNLQTLDVSFCRKLKSLPEFVASLVNLKIFDFKFCELLQALPKDFGSLTQLRKIDLASTQIKVLPEACTNLHNLEFLNLFMCEVPKEVTNWINLRYFSHNNREAPKGIGKLVLLQHLTYRVREQLINEPERNDGIEELGNLNFLEALGIQNLQNVKDPIDAERANLKGKQNLRKLYLSWGKIEEELGGTRSRVILEVFEALHPPAGLRTLDIRNFMGCDLPTWMCVPSGLPDLVWLNLDIKNCKGIKQLPASIGKLPRLRVMLLRGMSLESLDIGGFPSLIRLELTDMFLLEELCCSYPPCLQDLWINDCQRLREISPFLSLTSLVLGKVDDKLVCSVGRTQTSLQILNLRNIEGLIYFPINILQSNRDLQHMRIWQCNHFQGFRIYDDENQNGVALYGPELSSGSLQYLYFDDCPVLKFLPDLRGWTTLRELVIMNCPQVKESLKYDLKSLSFLKKLDVDFIQTDQE